MKIVVCRAQSRMVIRVPEQYLEGGNETSEKEGKDDKRGPMKEFGCP